MNKSNIHPKAKIEKNVIINDFCTIEEDVKIGQGTWIGPNVSIFNGAEIGENCKIYPGAIIASDPQDLKYKGEKTKVIIKKNTIIREYVTINKATKANIETFIGENVLIMAYSHIAHDCIIHDNVILVNNSSLSGHVEIFEHAIIGGVTAIQQFIKIGAHSYISGGSLVRKDIPPFIKAAGAPLSYYGVNSIGLARKNFNNNKINEINNIYRLIFQSNLNVTQAIKKINKEFKKSKEKNTITDFIANCKNGILKR